MQKCTHTKRLLISFVPLFQSKKKSVEFEPFDPKQPCLVLIFESATNWYNIELFLIEVFNIYQRYLRVHKIEMDSVQKVTLQFATSMEPHFQDLNDQKRELAKHYNVADMHIETENTPATAAAPDSIATEDQTHEVVESLTSNILYSAGSAFRVADLGQKYDRIEHTTTGLHHSHKNIQKKHSLPSVQMLEETSFCASFPP